MRTRDLEGRSSRLKLLEGLGEAGVPVGVVGEQAAAPGGHSERPPSPSARALALERRQRDLCSSELAGAHVGFNHVCLPVDDVRLGQPARLGRAADELKVCDRGLDAPEPELEQTKRRLDVEPPELVVVVVDERQRARRVIATRLLVASGCSEPCHAFQCVGRVHGL